MESDMVVAVRHRDVPGDLTRSSTCNHEIMIGRFLVDFAVRGGAITEIAPTPTFQAHTRTVRKNTRGEGKPASNSSRDTCYHRWGIEQQVEQTCPRGIMLGRAHA